MDPEYQPFETIARIICYGIIGATVVCALGVLAFMVWLIWRLLA